MFYIPSVEVFRPEEFFPPHIVKKHTDKNGNIQPWIWRLMDSRVTWTSVKLRQRFGCMIMNDYLWGGQNENRGFRDPISLIDWDEYKETSIIKASWSSFTSQHCFGRAGDSKFKETLAEEARQYIIKHKGEDDFKHITAIEKGVTWLHFDVRNFKVADQRFFIF